MIEFLPYVIVLVLLAYSIYRDEANRQERKDLLRMVKARDLDEVIRAEVAEKRDAEPETQPDFVPSEALDDEEFLQAVRGGDEK